MAQDIQVLQQRIDELELLVAALEQEKNREELIELPWAGNLGSWIWRVPSNRVIFNPKKALNLGFRPDQNPENVGFQFFTDLLHPEDFPPVMDHMRRHLAGIDPVYEVEYRIQHKDGSWRWYYDRGKITQRDPDGKPLQLVGIVFDVTRQKEMEAQLEQQNRQLKEMVDYDSLTGVFSRRALFGLLEHIVNQSQPLWVLMLDIDHFKQVNDTYGHDVGDEILIEVARLIQVSIRAEDNVGRYGGEEFLVILERVDEAAAIQIAQRIRTRVASHLFTRGIKLTISGGLAGPEVKGVDLLVRMADQRLYEAKRSGRNRITVHTAQ